MDYKQYIADVPDFPIKDVLFRDITPLMANGEAFASACDEIIALPKQRSRHRGWTGIAGFHFRMSGSGSFKNRLCSDSQTRKITAETISQTYELEYGTNTLCMHKDAIKPGMKVIIIDDLLATGGTIKASIDLVEKSGGIVVGLAFLIELTDLKGRELLKGYDLFTIIKY